MSMRYQAGIILPGYNALKVADAPTIGTATAGNAQVSVAFTAPSDIGGGAITGYTAQSTKTSDGTLTLTNGASSPITVTGLTNGQAYTFKVLATNAYGPSAYSTASNSATPATPYFIGIFGGTEDDFSRGISSDSSGNLYVVGTVRVSGVDYAALLKYNSSGTLQFQQRLSGTSTRALSIYVSSSNSIYVNGESNCPIVIYDTSGNIQFQRLLNTNDFKNIYVDASSNYYICGSGNPDGLQIIKYNSSNTLQWQKHLRNNSYSVAGYGVVADTSGNVYGVGYTTITSVLTFQIVKYDSTGTIQWQRRLGDGSAIGRAIAIDSSNNIYVCGQANDICVLAKYDSSGAIQWQTQLTGANYTYGYGVAVDSSNNIYICGSFYPSSGSEKIIIAKYNSSGTIQWQRTLASSTGGCFGQSIKIDSNNDVCVSGYITYTATSISDFIFMRVPNDGTKTGTYSVGSNSITYATSSLTSSASSLTDTTTSTASNTSGLTASTPSNTNVTTSFTSTTTGI